MIAPFVEGDKMRDILLVLLGGGFTAALLKFIEFLITHHTHKKEHKEDVDNKVDRLRTELKNHLTEVNADWKTKYCDRNAEGIAELAAVSKDLKDNIMLLTGTITEMKEYNKTVGSAVNGIIHDRIIHNVDEFIDRKGITVEEIATLKSMYYPYKNLGGNGDVETAFEQALKLPVITKQEATDRDVILKRKRIYENEESALRN